MQALPVHPQLAEDIMGNLFCKPLLPTTPESKGIDLRIKPLKNYFENLLCHRIQTTCSLINNAVTFKGGNKDRKVSIFVIDWILHLFEISYKDQQFENYPYFCMIPDNN